MVDSSSPILTPKTPPNEGARLLSATGASLRAVARAAGVSYELVRQWKTGGKLPAAPARKLLQAAYKIPAKSWDLAQLTAPSAVVSSSTPIDYTPAAPPPVPRDDARVRLEAQLVRLDGLRADPELSTAGKLSLEAAEGRALALLSRLSGEGLVVDEARLVRTPAFARLLATMTSALRPWPAALVAVADALDDIDRRPSAQEARR